MLSHFRWIICFLVLVERIYGDGTISINLIYYENTKGTGDNGHCCDGRSIFCEHNGCDHQFSLCLDGVSSSNEMSPCEYGKSVTNPVSNSNSINFGTSINGSPNPILFAVRGALPTAVAVKVDIVDVDGLSKNDHVDFLRSDMVLALNKPENFIFPGRTWLEIQISATCSLDFYNSHCQTYCAPPGANDHYTCDVISGNKICHSGWTGDNCDLAPCDVFICENGGTCDVTPHGRPLCLCTDDYRGKNCETHKCVNICAPGICIIRINDKVKFLCSCSDDKGNPIYGVEAACKFPEVTTTLQPSTTHQFLSNNDCNTIVQDPITGPGSRGHSGVYKIHPPGGESFDVYCHMTSSAEGWTVIQRRVDGSEDFFRGWDDYRDGFGTLEESGEYWLGLEKVHRLTSSKTYRLRIDILDYFGDLKYADYSLFSIAGEDDFYRLHIGGYSGDAGDALGYSQEDNTTVRHHDNMAFSTYDHDMDMSHYNCAKLFQSGWWFSSCFRSNLNGVYRPSTGDARCCAYKDRCVTWQTIDRMSFKRVEMKIIPVRR